QSRILNIWHPKFHTSFSFYQEKDLSVNLFRIIFDGWVVAKRLCLFATTQVTCQKFLRSYLPTVIAPIVAAARCFFRIWGCSGYSG
ncbi:MAG: hypothetical protein WCL14_10670, partial [Bacteroidota bacterium]